MQGKPNTATTITRQRLPVAVSAISFFFSWIQPLSNHTREGFSYPSYETTPRFFRDKPTPPRLISPIFFDRVRSSFFRGEEATRIQFVAEGGNGSGIGCGRVLFVYYSPLPPRRYEQHVQRRCGRRTWWFWLVGRGVVQVEGEARVAEPWLRITRRRAFPRRLLPPRELYDSPASYFTTFILHTAAASSSSSVVPDFSSLPSKRLFYRGQK